MSMATVGSLLTGYVAVALAALRISPLAPMGICHFRRRRPAGCRRRHWVILMFAPPRITVFAHRYVALLTGLQVVGGLLAVRTGRPLARSLIRLFLPASL